MEIISKEEYEEGPMLGCWGGGTGGDQGGASLWEGEQRPGQAALLGSGSSLQASGPYKEAEEMLLSSISGPSLSGI